VILPSKKVLSIFIITAALVVAIIITFGKDKSSTAINFANDLVVGEKLTIPENQNWQNELTGAISNTNLVQTEEETAPGETVTDTISRTLVSNYLALKENDLLDQNSAQKLIDQTITYVEKTGAQSVQITETQLNVVADNGKISITSYGEALGNISKKYKLAATGNEIKVMTNAIKSQDSSQTKELESLILLKA